MGGVFQRASPKGLKLAPGSCFRPLYYCVFKKCIRIACTVDSVKHSSYGWVSMHHWQSWAPPIIGKGLDELTMSVSTLIFFIGRSTTSIAAPHFLPDHWQCWFQHGQAALTYRPHGDKDMEPWTCSIGMKHKHGHAVWALTCNSPLFMLNGKANSAWTWTYSTDKDMQHRQAAWTSNMDMQQRHVS